MFKHRLPHSFRQLQKFEKNSRVQSVGTSVSNVLDTCPMYWTVVSNGLDICPTYWTKVVRTGARSSPYYYLLYLLLERLTKGFALWLRHSPTLAPFSRGG